MKAPAVAVSCALDGRGRKVRAGATTGVLGVFLVGTPLVVALAVVRALSDRAITDDGGAGLGRADVVALLIAFTAICMWLPGAVAAVGELRGRDRPVRPSRFVPPSVRRVVAAQVETSLLGAGTLKGWTSTRVDAPLDDLEVPARRALATVRSRPVAVDLDVEGRVGAEIADTDRSPPGRPRRAARRDLTTTSPPWQFGTTAYLVQRGDTWWGLAERFLGDGRRFAELKDLNVGRSQPDGTVVQRDTVLPAGWTIDVRTNGSKP